MEHGDQAGSARSCTKILLGMLKREGAAHQDIRRERERVRGSGGVGEVRGFTTSIPPAWLMRMDQCSCLGPLAEWS